MTMAKSEGLSGSTRSAACSASWRSFPTWWKHSILKSPGLTISITSCSSGVKCLSRSSNSSGPMMATLLPSSISGVFTAGSKSPMAFSLVGRSRYAS